MRITIISGDESLIMICCPVCKSTDVFWVTGGNLGQVYQCKGCGYRGSFILEIDNGEAVDPLEARDEQQH